MRLGKPVPYALLILCLLLLLAPAFRPGRLLSQFHPSRLAEVHSLDEKCLGQQGWISGWDSRFLCGYPAGMYQYQFSYLLMVGLHHLTGLSLDFCYKVLFVAGICFAAAMFMRLIAGRAGPWLAFAVTLALFLSRDIVWQMEVGYWNHVMALGLISLFVDRLARSPRLGGRDVLVLSGIYTITVIAHQFAAIAIGILLLGWLPQLIARQGWRVVVPWGVITIGALLMTSIYSLPIVLTRNWMGAQMPGMNDHSEHLLSTILTMVGLTTFDPMVHTGVSARVKSLIEEWPVWSASALALAILPVWIRGRLSETERRFCAGLALTLIPFIIIHLDLINFVPSEALHRATRQLAGERFLPYVHFCIFLLAAVSARHWMESLLGSDQSQPALAVRSARMRMAVVGALTLVFTLTAARTSYSLIRNGYLETDQTCAPMADLRKAWAWLAAHNDGNRRVLYESTFLNYPETAGDRGSHAIRQSTVMSLAALETGMPQAGGMLNVVIPIFERTRTSKGAILGRDVAETSTAEIKPTLREGNFGYVVTCSAPLFSMLSADAAFAKQEAFGAFTIFTYQEVPGNWAETSGGDPVELTLDPANDARMTARLNNSRAGNTLLVRQEWHPYWRATVEGQPLPLQATPFGLIEATLDRQGPMEIEFRFSTRKPAFVVLNILALLAWGAGWWFFRRAPASSPV